ncbi:MAG: response regulator transcription factor [Chloroflexia bacterium]
MAEAEGGAAARPRVLIIEDEPGIVDFLRLGLGYEGFRTQSAADGAAGLQMALDDPPDLVILDLMLPGLNGFDLCRRLRQVSRVPVIMLTARDDLDDRVQGLDLGADDYLTKPFQFKELAARVRAVLRRKSGPADGHPPNLLQLQDITLDPDSHEVHRGGRPVSLSLREYALLELFMRHPNQVLTRAMILDRAWGYDFMGEGNIIEVYVRYLRRKLGEPNPIGTVRGVGYVMRSRPEGADGA